MKNLFRNKQLIIRLTDEEKELFEKKKKLTRSKNMSSFIRKCVLEKEIYVVDLQPFRELQGLLFRYASNINQIAKRVNSGNNLYADDLKDMRKQIDDLSKELMQIHSLLLNKTTNKGDKI